MPIVAGTGLPVAAIVHACARAGRSTPALARWPRPASTARRWSRSSPTAPSSAARRTMQPVPAAGCGRRSSASRPSTTSSPTMPRSPSATPPSACRARAAARSRADSLEHLAKTWAGEEYWFWARRVLRKLRHGIRRAGQTGAPPAGDGEAPAADPGAPAACRQHRHGGARHGQLRPGAPAPGRAARRLAQREGAHRRLRRQFHHRRRTRPIPASRTRLAGLIGCAPPPRGSGTSPSRC